MSVYTKRAREIFAPTDAAGNLRSVSNAETQVWGTEVERGMDGAAAGRVDASSWSDLSAIAGDRPGQPAIVYGPDAGTHTDPVTGQSVSNEGMYAWSDSPAGWRRVADVQSELVHADNVGQGSANAIQATVFGPFNREPYRSLITLNFTEENTGAVTVSINGESPRQLVTNTGDPVPSGYLQAGMSALVQIDEGGNYRLFSYGDADAVLQAALQAAQDAQDAASEATLYDPTFRYKTVQDLLSSTRAPGGAGTRWQAGSFLYDEASPSATDHHVETAGGVKLYVLAGENGYDVKAIGAVGDGVADDTADILATPAPRYLSDGLYLVNTGVLDTESISGPGVLVSAGDVQRQTPASARKMDDTWRARRAFEDVFKSHAMDGGAALNYTAFGSACALNGKEIYTIRTGYNHEPEYTHSDVLHLYTYSKTDNPASTKQEIYRTPVGVELCNPNICPHPNRNGIALILVGERMPGWQLRVRLITFNVTTMTIESNRIILGTAANHFAYGNVLITPAGYLLFTTYDLDGTAIRVWRSTVALPISGDVTVANVSTLTDTVASEPCFGYWQDRLVLFWRRTGAAARLTYSYNKEGDGPWAATVFPTGTPEHAPVMLPYSDAKVFTSFFSRGTDRRYVGAVSSHDLVGFKVVNNIPTAGLATGGYTSIIDCGGYYAISAYSDFYTQTGEMRRTRFERIEVDKGMVDITMADPQRAVIMDRQDQVPNGANGVWVGSPHLIDGRLATDGRGYEIEFIAKKTMSALALSVVTSGTGDVSIDLYEDGNLLASTNAVAVSSADPRAVVLPFAAPQTLTPTKVYRAKLAGTAAMAMYDKNHNNRARSAMRFPAINITNLYSPANSPLGSQRLVAIGIRLI